LNHPSINTICAKVKEALIERKIEPYNEETGRGILRYLQFVVERKSRRIQLALIVNRQAQDSLLDGFVKGIYGKGGIHSIWLNFQPDQTNRIFGDGWALCDGETYLWERLKDIECAFHPGVFGQANLNLFEKAIARIQEWVAPGKKILELYAGVGVIGLNLAAAAKQVLCVEINPLSSECFHMSCLKLAVDVKNKIHFQISSAEAAACLIADNEVIVVDPTRKGLDKGVLEALYGAQRGSQLIYLSCGPLSFQQDAEKLLSHGWKIEKAEAYLFFPGTDHVEVLCNFKKVSG